MTGKVSRLRETDADRAVRDRTVAAITDELRGYVERLESLAAEKAGVADHEKAVMAEAKARGYDTRALRRVLKARRVGWDAVAEQDAVFELYRDALNGGGGEGDA